MSRVGCLVNLSSELLVKTNVAIFLNKIGMPVLFSALLLAGSCSMRCTSTKPDRIS